MPFIDAKVYFDGSHYICIPYREPIRKRKKKVPDDVDEDGEIKEDTTPLKSQEKPSDKPDVSGLREITPDELKEIFADFDVHEYIAGQGTSGRCRRDVFDEVYELTRECSKKERKEQLFTALRPLCEDDEECDKFINEQLERVKKNNIKKRVRLVRKVNLQQFNYFVTFTYSDELHTEDSFRKKLKQTLNNFSSKRGWKYIGVFERSPEKHRLHFHGLFVIPEGTIPGELVEMKGYSVRLGRVQTTYECAYFATRFGIVDFEPITNADIGGAVNYLLKYIEKSGEKLMYSRGLPQYFISDIADEDVICPYDEEERKYVLYDKFTCYDYGEVMGTVSPEVIEKMRKSN